MTVMYCTAHFVNETFFWGYLFIFNFSQKFPLFSIIFWWLKIAGNFIYFLLFLIIVFIFYFIFIFKKTRIRGNTRYRFWFFLFFFSLRFSQTFNAIVQRKLKEDKNFKTKLNSMRLLLKVSTRKAADEKKKLK